MTHTTTTTSVLYMTKSKTALYMATKNNSDTTAFHIESIHCVRPEQPQEYGKATVEIVHDEGSMCFQAGTNRERDILCKLVSALVKSLQRRTCEPLPVQVGRPTLAVTAESCCGSTRQPVTPGVKSFSTPGILLMKQTKPANGYRIVETKKNSPADKLGFQVFDDVVIALDGVALEVLPTGPPAVQFSKHLIHKLETEVVLTLFNSRTLCSRDVAIIPTRRWLCQNFIGVDARYDPLVTAEVLLPV